jgi:hypothetical protein
MPLDDGESESDRSKTIHNTRQRGDATLGVGVCTVEHEVSTMEALAVEALPEGSTAQHIAYMLV